MKLPSTRFNIISEHGDGMGFAARLVQEGYDTRLWMRDKLTKTIGDNIVEKVGDLEDLIVDASPSRDVYVFDVSGNGVIADYLHQNGYPVLGGSILADRLERDREFGADVMLESGITIPETIPFHSFEEGIEHVRENPETRWVYKPSKILADMDISPSHVSYDAEDMIELLTGISKQAELANPEFELQAFEKGVAFSSELWFNQGQLIEPLTNHTLERKQSLNGDLGGSGGCLGNITWFCAGCKVCREARKLEEWAMRENYHGMLDLNVIVTEKGRCLGLEFTPRFGYDASPTLLWELVQGGIGPFFESIARRDASGFDLRDGFGGALRITIPPWPAERFEAEEGVPIRGLDEKVLERNTFLYNVRRDESGNLCSSGAWGCLLLLTHHSRDYRASLAKPLQWAEELRVKNKQYRTDLAKQFTEDLEKLEAAGVELNLYEEEIA